MSTLAITTFACLLCSLSLSYVHGQQINASFVFPNGTSPQESDGTFRACVLLNMAPITSISVRVNAIPVINTEEGVNFRDPDRVLIFNTTEPTEQCLDIVLLKDDIVRIDSQIFQVKMSSSELPVSVAFQAIVLRNSDVLRVSFSQSSYTSQEETPLSICAEVIGGTYLNSNSFSLTADVLLQDDSATADVDFISLVPSTLFASGSTVGAQVCTTVNIINDTSIESTEYFRAVLSTTMPQLQIENGTALIAITDNDAASVSIEPLTVTVIEGNFSTTVTEQLCLVLSIIDDLQRSVVIGVETREGTALDQSDFSPIQSSLTFLPGSLQGSRMCFNISINGDNVLETDETFKVKISLTAPDMAQSGQDETIITIKHDGDVNICPSLQNPVNGIVDVSGFSGGATAEYSCNANFILRNGAPTRTCNTGAWSGSEPICVTACPLVTVANGVVSSGTSSPYSEGDTVTYMCSIGYTLTGNEVRMCLASGWTGSDPTCTIVDCGALSSPEGGRVEHAMTTYLSVASYSCDNNLRLIGPPNRQCLDTGDWEGSTPTCGAKAITSSGVLLLLVMTVLLNIFL